MLLAAVTADRPGHDRLYDALGPNRVREVLQRVLADIVARLVLAFAQQVHRDLPQAVVAVAAHDGAGLCDGFAE